MGWDWVFSRRIGGLDIFLAAFLLGGLLRVRESEMLDGD